MGFTPVDKKSHVLDKNYAPSPELHSNMLPRLLNSEEALDPSEEPTTELTNRRELEDGADVSRAGQATITDLLAESSAELDALLSETQKIHERSWRVIHSLLRDLELKAWQAVDAAVSGVRDKIHERVTFETSAVLENFNVEADARLAARMDLLLNKASELQRDLEHDIGAFIVRKRQELSEASAVSIREMQDYQSKISINFQKHSEQLLETFKQSLDESTGSIRRVIAELTAQMETQTAQSLDSFGLRLEGIGEDLVSRAEARIKNATQASLDEVLKLARAGLDREITSSLVHILRARVEQVAETLRRPEAVSPPPEARQMEDRTVLQTPNGSDRKIG
jgi:hypothetical protein